MYLAIVTEILQSIRQSDMSPILSRIYSAPGGTEALDVLMKYMYGHAQVTSPPFPKPLLLFLLHRSEPG